MKAIQATALVLMTMIFQISMPAESSKLPENELPPCPEECKCQVTDQGFYKALCFNISVLHKYSMKYKNHNIEILDLSYNKIVKINSDLDRFTEMISLDLSHNDIKNMNKFLSNSKKLVELNLSNNYLRTLSASVIPKSVRYLDVRNNIFKDVPSDLYLLHNLKSIELIGNHLHCDCKNIKSLHFLHKSNVTIDDVKCVSPPTENEKKWSDVNLLEICKMPEAIIQSSNNNNFSEEMMLGDQPQDSVNELDSGIILDGEQSKNENEDDKEFLAVEPMSDSSSPEPEIFNEGSGDLTNEDIPNFGTLSSIVEFSNSTLDEQEGSGDYGSGIINTNISLSSTYSPLFEDEDNIDYEGSGDEITSSTEPPVTVDFPLFFPDLDDHNYTTPEPIDFPQRPSVFQGKINWDNTPDEDEIEPRVVIPDEAPPKIDEDTDDDIVTKKSVVEESDVVKDDKKDDEDLLAGYQEEPKAAAKTSMGTYICIAIIIGILVGLIGITLFRSKMRKDRERRQMRQQKMDVEKAGKEMVDMNKSLLGKPAPDAKENDKKMNGNYELVPTHENRKKLENGNAEKQRKSEEPVKKEDSQEQTPTRNGNTINPSANALPIKEDQQPVINVISPENKNFEPNTNGYPEHDHHPHQDFLPIMSPPDTGRVKIKLAETPKPKTPVLVTRSRSNAGDIIITPIDQGVPHQNST